MVFLSLVHLAPIRSHPPPPRPHRGHLVPSTPPPVLVTVGRMIGTVGDAGNPFFRHRWPRLPLLRALPWAPLASWLWTSSVLRPSFRMSACIGRHRPGQTKDRVGTRAWDRNLEPTPSSAVLQTSLRSWVIPRRRSARCNQPQCRSACHGGAEPLGCSRGRNTDPWLVLCLAKIAADFDVVLHQKALEYTP